MCKIQQPVPDNQGRHAPSLPAQPIAVPQASSPPPQAGNGVSPIGRSTANESPPRMQHDFDSPKGGCDCLLAAVLIAASAMPLLLLVLLVF